MELGEHSNDERGDERFRTGFQIGFALGRELGFGEGVESFRRVVERILRKQDAEADAGAGEA